MKHAGFSIKKMKKSKADEFFALACEIFPQAKIRLLDKDEVYIAYSGPDRKTAVGFLHLRPLANSIYLQGIGVKPSKRRSGIGRALLSLALKRASCMLPSGELYLKVKASNIEAVRLYHLQGFRLSRMKGDVLKLKWSKPN
jgi:ribosomal protein S18 acetylase RimI-like enzyme